MGGFCKCGQPDKIVAFATLIKSIYLIINALRFVMWPLICMNCNFGLQLCVATANCRCGLPLRIAAANCRCGLPLRTATANGHCRCQLQAFLENSSVAFYKTSAALLEALCELSARLSVKPAANCLQNSPRNLRVRLCAL